MGPKISEAEWKLFRKIHENALERFCDRVLAEAVQLATKPGESSHKRYVAVFELLRTQDKRMGQTFDNPGRSSALYQLASMRAQDLLTEEEFAGFSPETRAKVDFLLTGR